jgi:hypothetical protein
MSSEGEDQGSKMAYTYPEILYGSTNSRVDSVHDNWSTISLTSEKDTVRSGNNLIVDCILNHLCYFSFLSTKQSLGRHANFYCMNKKTKLRLR